MCEAAEERALRSAQPRRAAGRGAAAGRELAVAARRLSARRAVRAP